MIPRKKKPHKEKMIEASQRMINEQNNPIVNKHFKLQIKTLLQKAPRDADKLERLLKVKERQKENATYMEDTERLVAEEIEMLRVVLYLVCRNNRRSKAS
jgi:hypothetical protein